jgi:hypothetical protein
MRRKKKGSITSDFIWNFNFSLNLFGSALLEVITYVLAFPVLDVASGAIPAWA